MPPSAPIQQPCKHCPHQSVVAVFMSSGMSLPNARFLHWKGQKHYQSAGQARRGGLPSEQKLRGLHLPLRTSHRERLCFRVSQLGLRVGMPQEHRDWGQTSRRALPTGSGCACRVLFQGSGVICRWSTGCAEGLYLAGTHVPQAAGVVVGARRPQVGLRGAAGRRAHIIPVPV